MSKLVGTYRFIIAKYFHTGTVERSDHAGLGIKNGEIGVGFTVFADQIDIDLQGVALSGVVRMISIQCQLERFPPGCGKFFAGFD